MSRRTSSPAGLRGWGPDASGLALALLLLSVVAVPCLARAQEVEGQRERVRRLAELGSDTALIPIEEIYVGPFDRPGQGTRLLRGELPVLTYESGETLEGIVLRVTRYRSRRLADRLDPSSRRWLGKMVPLHDLSDGRIADLYIELVSSISRAARLCYGGEIDACQQALALVPMEDTLTAWYGPEGRRRIVARRRWRPPDSATARRCVMGGRDGACLELLRKSPLEPVRPLKDEAHRLLVRLAVETGGPGAYGHLLAPGPGGLGDRLVAAAGVPLDTLTVLWRQRLIAARPPSTILTARTGLVALVWILAFGYLSTRSSRWRSS